MKVREEKTRAKKGVAAPPLLLLQRWAAMPPVARGRVDRFIAMASVIVVLSEFLLLGAKVKEKAAASELTTTEATAD
jgi:hypothetical protein